jgi:osmotically-inducible protein OsmY
MSNSDDLRLTRSIRDALDASLDLDGLAVQCRVQDGAAVLYGQMANCVEREHAARLTARTPGVWSIRNELTVRVSWEPGRVTDEDLAARVRVCVASTEVDWTGVVIEVVNHMVRLGGHTRSETDRAAVRHAVGGLGGVTLVENRIAIDARSWALIGAVSE